MPASGVDGRIIRAKLCLVCGYIHPRDEAAADLCLHCETRLDASTMEFPQALFEQPTVRASLWQRISSEEEERAREGYQITTQYRFPARLAVCNLALSAPSDCEPLIEVEYVSQAEIWRINHGWHRPGDHNGFVIDSNTAYGSAKAMTVMNRTGHPSARHAVRSGRMSLTRAICCFCAPYQNRWRRTFFVRWPTRFGAPFSSTTRSRNRRSRWSRSGWRYTGASFLGSRRRRHRRLGTADWGAWRISAARDCAHDPAFRRHHGRGAARLGGAVPGGLLRLPAQLR